MLSEHGGACCCFGSDPFEPWRYPVVSLFGIFFGDVFHQAAALGSHHEVSNSEAERRTRASAHGADRKPTRGTMDARRLAQVR
jgi:hypothetical protein